MQDKINELENITVLDEDSDESVLSKIDPDLNMLYNFNDAIQYSSSYYNFHNFNMNIKSNSFSILNANIRGVSSNLDEIKY